MARRGGRARAGAPARIRVIGGEWRGRRIPVAPRGVRPTPDRVRETLFNWLAPVIEGARVLDLFAGTGAVGLEALSRGAGRVQFVESDPRVAESLRETLETFGAGDRAQVLTRDARSFLAESPEPWDLVALDPPFRSNLVPACAADLERGWLAPAARVYVETDAAESPAAVPEGWQWLREATAGAVRARLYRVTDQYPREG